MTPKASPSPSDSKPRLPFPVVCSALFRQTAVPAGRAAHGHEELQPGGAGRQQPLSNDASLDKGKNLEERSSAHENKCVSVAKMPPFLLRFNFRPAV